MLTETLEKFQYPQSLIKSYAHWHLLLRPEQTTLGSLVLICKEDVGEYSQVSAAAITEQGQIVREIETILKDCFSFDKINYLMLMMVDPAVHFHVIPRYQDAADFDGQSYADKGWPALPLLSESIEMSDDSQKNLLDFLRSKFDGHDLQEYQSQKKYSRLFTSGCFDIFHHGHLNVLKRSKALCDHLIVGVSTDELILKEKGRLPVIPYAERVSILQALDLVDEVIPQVDKDKQKMVDTYKVDAISVGDDWKGRYPPVTCEMEYFVYTPSVSSTVLKQKLNITPKKADS